MKKKKRNNIKYSLKVIVGSLLLFVVLILRLTQIALATEIDGTNLKELASKRTTRTDTILAKRGTIFSSDGETLAQNVSSYKIIAYLDEKRTTNPKKPQHVVDKEKTAKELSPILGIEEEKLLQYLSKENVYQTEFGSKGKGLTELTKQKIDDLNLPGIDFIESYKRYYPKGQFASYTLGYAKTTSEEENIIVGEMGIEKEYDNILKGEDGYITYQKDLRGYKIADTIPIQKDATQGKDIYLTLDSSIQFFVEQAINNADRDYDYEWFHITIADAKTGAILATANSPSFDPNTRNITNYLDTLVSQPFEPGSTMKTFTYMAAMENGVYDGTETYKSGVYVTKDGTQIGDWDRNGWGMISYDRGYALSSNVGVINIINRHMNSMMLRQYFKKLGFGKTTKIELPNEQPGKIEFKYETEILNAGFGQGITTTPIQHIQAMTTLTNDGILLRPYVVEKIVDPITKEVILQNGKDEKERVASTATVEKMIQLMDDCVNGAGNTGIGFKIDGGQLIGKTGTAQIAKENGRGYISGKSEVISSFSGIYPKNDPQIIIYAAVKRPTNGSQTPLSRAVKEIVHNVSKYYGNDDSKQNTIEITNYKVPSFINTTLTSDKIKYVVIGEGDKVVKQSPSPDTTMTNQDTIYLITNDRNQKVPSVKGLSSKVAKDLLQKLSIKVMLDGVGYVTEQSITAGTEITPNMEIKLTLQPKFSS